MMELDLVAILQKYQEVEARRRGDGVVKGVELRVDKLLGKVRSAPGEIFTKLVTILKSKVEKFQNDIKTPDGSMNELTTALPDAAQASKAKAT